IEGGDIPFAVEAIGAQVRIQGLRFVHPKGRAIFVFAVNGLVIANCRIEGVEAVPNPAIPTSPLFGGGIFVGTRTVAAIPSELGPALPENVSGTLIVINNNIDVGGTAEVNSLGIAVFNVGKSPDKEVDIYISGN